MFFRLSFLLIIIVILLFFTGCFPGPVNMEETLEFSSGSKGTYSCKIYFQQEIAGLMDFNQDTFYQEIKLKLPDYIQSEYYRENQRVYMLFKFDFENLQDLKRKIQGINGATPPEITFKEDGSFLSSSCYLEIEYSPNCSDLLINRTLYIKIPGAIKSCSGNAILVDTAKFELSPFTKNIWISYESSNFSIYLLILFFVILFLLLFFFKKFFRK